MKILILGCGYVGKALAKFWSAKNHTLTCTTKSLANISSLQNITQKSLLLDSSDTEQLESLIRENDLIVVTIAASSVEDYKNTYLRTAQHIHSIAAKIATPKTLFYTSSAFVYGDHQGKWVDETSSLLSTSEQGKLLIATEEEYLSLQKLSWNVAIFRLAEIYGPGRDLSEKVLPLQHRVLPGKGDHYTNMIHVEDIVSSMHYILEHRFTGIFNLADEDHPTRQELYNKICDHLGVERIIWDPNLNRLNRGNKRISNHKIKTAGYTFLHPHRILYVTPQV